MAASVNLVQFFYSDGSTLPVKVWVMDGTMSYPEWPDANMVFVLNHPRLISRCSLTCGKSAALRF